MLLAHTHYEGKKKEQRATLTFIASPDSRHFEMQGETGGGLCVYVTVLQ